MLGSYVYSLLFSVQETQIPSVLSGKALKSYHWTDAK